jgi:hypothetical protein
MSISQPLPNFDRAEFHGDPPLPDQCAYCHRGIAVQYYRVDGNLACPTCAQQAQSLIPPDSHKAYSRAVLFGIGAAFLGFIGYALVTILTGWTIGYAAIGVGYLVGKAMKAGSRGLGGRRYQITAAILTYAAVAMAFVPIVIYQTRKDAPAKPAPHPVTSSATTGTTDNPPATAAAPTNKAESLTAGGFVVAILTLLGLGLVSPFLELASSPFGGLIGIFIVFIGISAAWKLTQRVASEVDGPYEHTPSLR